MSHRDTIRHAMKQKVVLTLVLFVLLLCSRTTSVEASDLRVLKLRKYFSTYNVLLADQAESFVKVADTNNLDYRLLPAISGVESTFGRNYIVGTYNVYGWGGGLIYFKSWTDGIKQIATAINQKPYRGVEPEALGPIYCPPNSVKWAYNVRYFMNEIEQTELADLPVKQLEITL